ncbi:MAG TPA: hypothetical protein PK733_18060 [Clostridiales bacterium]|nr:hypothetical protein [Clostridiales bacterium]
MFGSEYCESLSIILNDKQNEQAKYEVKVLQKYLIGELNPWKLQTADVDGDGNIEISLGVYKTAKFHQAYDKRPFLYN